MRRRMQRNPWLVILSFLAALALGASAGQDREVDDGMDVYFRDADLSALSDQDVAVYPQDDAGESTRLDRAFPDAPPQIPHSVEDMLPITAGDNECLICHHPENAASEEDAPLPKSHFQRAVMREGKKGEPMAWLVLKYEDAGDVAGTRHDCTMCHTPQATNADTPDSEFVTLKRDSGD